MAGAATPTVGAAARARPGRIAQAGLGPARRLAGYLLLLVLFAVAWEALKWLGGDPWRLHGTVAGLRIDYEHLPPFHWTIASDLALPHIWAIVGAFFEPSRRFGPPEWQVLLGSAIYTFREAVAGFAIGAVLGLALGVVFVRFRLLERALVPYVVASQTVPLITIAPIIVISLGFSWTSVAVISAYLTFFPVTVASLRGLRSADPRAFELFRSCAASDRQVLWKLRLPSAVPYLFAAFRISAAASVVGAIIGELPTGIPDGLGGQILQDVQYYITGPQRLWAAVVASALLGLVAVGLVRLAEQLLTRSGFGAAAADGLA